MTDEANAWVRGIERSYRLQVTIVLKIASDRANTVLVLRRKNAPKSGSSCTSERVLSIVACTIYGSISRIDGGRVAVGGRYRRSRQPLATMILFISSAVRREAGVTDWPASASCSMLNAIAFSGLIRHSNFSARRTISSYMRRALPCFLALSDGFL